MDIAQVAPELRAPLRRTPKINPASWLTRTAAGIALGLMPAAKVPGVTIRSIRSGGARLRLYIPAVRRSRAALLWIHGGGYIIGAAVQDDRMCAATALALGAPVISVEYRLAPKHRFPAALDDCHAVWTWLQASAASLDIDPARIAIGGESAGGGLAACLVQRIHDAPGPKAAAQWLFCPMLDDRTAADRDLDAVRHFVWDNTSNLFAWGSYLGRPAGAGEAPPYAVAARRTDLAGLPPAWIGVGEIDLFFREDHAYAERLRAAGVETEFKAVPAAPHAIEAWAPEAPLSKALVAEAHAWLAERLAGD